MSAYEHHDGSQPHRTRGSFAPPRAPGAGPPPAFTAAPRPATIANRKSGSVAIVLTMLVSGAGHWYCSEVGRGFAFLGATILAAFSLAFLVGLLALPAVWVWATIDAYKAAERHNARLVAPTPVTLRA